MFNLISYIDFGLFQLVTYLLKIVKFNSYLFLPSLFFHFLLKQLMYGKCLFLRKVSSYGKFYLSKNFLQRQIFNQFYRNNLLKIQKSFTDKAKDRKSTEGKKKGERKIGAIVILTVHFSPFFTAFFLNNLHIFEFQSNDSCFPRFIAMLYILLPHRSYNLIFLSSVFFFI